VRGSAAPRGARKFNFSRGRLSHLKRLSAAAPPDKSLLGGGPIFRRDRPRADAVEVEKPSERVVVGDVFWPTICLTAPPP